MILDPSNYPGLPKWPMAFVTGDSVTPEQAKEIIFRTDSSLGYPSEYGFGNDRAFGKRCIDLFGWRKVIDLQEMAFDKGKEGDPLLQRMREAGFISAWQIGQKWAEEMGYVETSYVHNTWLASSYIGGPYGWMSPDGNIHHDGHNYGKWPSVEDIRSDWAKLAAAFPYLNLACTLFDGENCAESKLPVCTIRVWFNSVTVHAPDLSMHDRNPARYDDSTLMANLAGIMSGSNRHEQGWPAEWVEEYGARSTAAMRKVAPFLFD